MTGTPSRVTLLYTAHLADHLALLPQLSSLIQQERRAASGPVFLIDLGDSCSPASWICRVTQGRAGLMILDGMGYDAAVIGGLERAPIPPASVGQLRGRLVMPLVEWHTAHRLSKSAVSLTVVTGDACLPLEEAGIRIDRVAQAAQCVAARELVLGDVPGGAVGTVVMSWPEWRIESAGWRGLADDTPPDPTIHAIMELIEAEARLYAQQQGGIL